MMSVWNIFFWLIFSTQTYCRTFPFNATKQGVWELPEHSEANIQYLKLHFLSHRKDWDSDRLRDGRPDTILRKGKRLFFITQRLDLLWGPPGPIFNGYLRLFPWWYSCRGVKLTTHFHLVSSQEWWNYTSTLPYVFMAWCLVN
jgi:hypothetical protein